MELGLVTAGHPWAVQGSNLRTPACKALGPCSGVFAWPLIRLSCAVSETARRAGVFVSIRLFARVLFQNTFLNADGRSRAP